MGGGLLVLPGIRLGFLFTIALGNSLDIQRNYGESARETCSEVPERVHPHLFRHTRAMDLYRAGMPLSYIAEFLGHVNVNTTDIYSSADMTMLRNALEKADPELAKEIPRWKDEESLKKLCGL